MKVNVKLKPGQLAPATGKYEAVGPRGGKKGFERTVQKGAPLPPAPYNGVFYRLVNEKEMP